MEKNKVENWNKEKQCWIFLRAFIPDEQTPIKLLHHWIDRREKKSDDERKKAEYIDELKPARIESVVE